MEEETPKKRDLTFWADYVSKQNGNSFFLPEKFKSEYDELEKKRKELNDLLLEVGRAKLKFNVAQDKLILNIREDQDERGNTDNWSKDIGFHEQSAKDGFVIVNLIEAR